MSPSPLPRRLSILVDRHLKARRLLHESAGRAIDRGASLRRIYRILRRGLIAGLRTGLAASGQKDAGGLTWAGLLERVAGTLNLNEAEQSALSVIANMPRQPEEEDWRRSSEAAIRYLAQAQSHENAAQTLLEASCRPLGERLGIRDGRWIIHRTFGPMKLLAVHARLGATATCQPDRTRLVDLIDCLKSGIVRWQDDEASIAALEEQMVCPVSFPEPPAPVPPDPARAAMTFLMKTEIAGTWYHDARRVVDRLTPGMALCLEREPDNRFDVDAVAVRLPSGEKLGYVPRRCNGAISRRLADGIALGAWLDEGDWSDEDPMPSGPAPWLGLEIRSPLPGDAPTEAEIAETRRQQKQIEPLPSPTPEEMRLTESYWPARFALGGLDKARSAMRAGDLPGVIKELWTLLKWAKEAWLHQQGQTPELGNGWQSMEHQFRSASREHPLGMALPVLAYEIEWRCSHGPRKGSAALALALLRMEALLHEHVPPPDECHEPKRGLRFVITLPPSPEFPAVSPLPLARRYTPWRRLETLWLLRYLLRLGQRAECFLPVSSGDLRRLRMLNRDRPLVIAALRRISASHREKVRRCLLPDEAGKCQPTREAFLEFFPELVPNSAKWHLIDSAAVLLAQEAPCEEDLRRLRLELELLQPQRGRHGRRLPRDGDLFITEHLLLARETLDLLPALQATTLPMPYKRQNKLRWDVLAEWFDILSTELFGLNRQDMLRTWPALMAEAGNLDFALEAWRRVVAHNRKPDAIDTDLEASVARVLLEEALISCRGPWRDSLAAQIPALDCLCPWGGHPALPDS